MMPSSEVALTKPPRRDEAATQRAGAPAPPPRQAGSAPPPRDTILGDLIFLLRFAFGRY